MVFRFIEIAGNTSCCKQWTCSHHIMHFVLNLNRKQRSFPDRGQSHVQPVSSFYFFHSFFVFLFFFFLTKLCTFVLLNMVLILAYDFNDKPHCFESIFFAQVKQLYQLTLLFPGKCRLFFHKTKRIITNMKK